MANTKFQHKRTTVSGRLPNTTNSSNTSYIDAGEFAVNLTDGKVISSNGTTTFEVGANLTSLYSGNSTVFTTVNATSFSGTSNNATNLNGQAASFYTNATNITTGTLPYSQLPANVVIWSNTNTFSAPQTFGANVFVSSGYMRIGTGSGFDFGTTSQLEVESNANTYGQIVFQNANTGTGASADIAITADNGNNTSNFVNLGINSSTYNDAAFTITGAADAYLYSANTKLVMGTATSQDIVFHAGGTLAANRVMSINTSALAIANSIGLIANGSLGTSGQVLVSNGTGIYWGSATGIASNTIITSGTGSNQAITLSSTAIIANDIIVTYNGLRQTPNSYVVTSGTLYVTAPSGSDVVVQLAGGPTGPTGPAGANGTNGTINTAAQYTWSNVQTHTANIVLNTTTLQLGNSTIATAISANGSNGSSGQVLTSNGVSVYWSTVSGINTAAQYTWSNVQTHTANIVLNTAATALQLGNSTVAVAISANSSNGSSGQVLASNGTSVYWSTISGGATLVSNTTDTQTFYIPMANTISGTWSNGVVSDTKLYFVPSTGTLNATIFNSLSDKNIKDNIESIPSALNIVRNLDGVSFNWKDNGKKSYGVIAQEVEEILPDLVSGSDPKSVNYSGIIAFLINAIKELDIEVQNNKCTCKTCKER